MTSTRRIFASDSDVRSGTRSSSTTTPMSSSAHIPNGTVPHSTSATVRSNSYHPQVTYTPQSSGLSRPLSVHPQPISSPSYSSETASFSSRPLSTYHHNHHHHHHPNSLNSTTNSGTTLSNSTTNGASLAVKSIDPMSKGVYRVVFSDSSSMLLQADCSDGQIFIDTQGKRHPFDRRQIHQPEPIRERLALMQQDPQVFLDYNNLSSQQQ